MTSQDFIRAEADNTDRIILYKEGLFWKAYERSAYILCTQVRPFKPTKKSLKSLDGGHIVSVGFPWKHEQKHIGALERLESSDERLTLAAASAIDPADFEAWKALLPLHTPAAPRRAPASAQRSAPYQRQVVCSVLGTGRVCIQTARILAGLCSQEPQQSGSAVIDMQHARRRFA